MTTRRTLVTLMGAAAALALTAGASFAQEFTLRMHQFLPAQANVPRLVLDVWADNVERDSGGRIRIERHHAMALGGTPPELMDQVMDGVADIIWTVNGYTPGRFPRTEVLELPFFVTDARAAKSEHGTVKKLYEKNRGSAKKNVVEAVPELAKLIDKHLTASDA